MLANVKMNGRIGDFAGYRRNKVYNDFAGYRRRNKVYKDSIPITVIFIDYRDANKYPISDTVAKLLI